MLKHNNLSHNFVVTIVQLVHVRCTGAVLYIYLSLRAFKTAIAMPSYFEAERTVRFRGISRAVVGDDDRNRPKSITFAWGIRHTDREFKKELLLFILVVKNENGCVKLTKLEVKIIILCFILLLLVCYAFQDILLQLSVSLRSSSVVK